MNESNRASVDSTFAAAAARAGVNPQLLIVLGAFALTALLYSITLVEIFELWAGSNKRHWFVIVVGISLWLVWRDRFGLGSLELSSSIPGVVVVLAGSVGWLVFHYAGLTTLSALVLPVLALAAILAAGGLHLARRATFPLAFLYFGLPVWDPVNTALQAMTAQVTVWVTRLAGIPAIIEENIIHIPAGWFEVAGGCSGLNYFLVGLAMATLDGKLTQANRRSRVLLVALACLLALLTNWVRVFIVILAGHLTDMQHYLVRVDHYGFGWVLFAFASIGYVFISSRLARVKAGPAAAAAQRAGSFSWSWREMSVMLPLTGMALAFGPLWLGVRSAQHETKEPPAPPAFAGWVGPEPLMSDWQPVFANPDEEFRVGYRREATTRVAVYRAAYHVQRQGRELRGHENTITGNNYALQSSGVVTLTVQGSEIRVTEQRVQAGDGRRILIWSLYGIDHKPAAMDLRDQLRYGLRSLLQSPTASVVAFAADCSEDCLQARPRLEALAVQALPGML